MPHKPLRGSLRGGTGDATGASQGESPWANLPRSELAVNPSGVEALDLASTPGS
ncbi:hypothetical protein LCGC14_0819800 [marine sediment metagenome]|uniref:Uncharacterized protein n=1 Tax=marine sediment metagenome TaxID=412755 RepID=A0A0F9S498_9ZZZZ